MEAARVRRFPDVVAVALELPPLVALPFFWHGRDGISVGILIGAVFGLGWIKIGGLSRWLKLWAARAILLVVLAEGCLLLLAVGLEACSSGVLCDGPGASAFLPFKVGLWMLAAAYAVVSIASAIGVGLESSKTPDDWHRVALEFGVVAGGDAPTAFAARDGTAFASRDAGGELPQRERPVRPIASDRVEDDRALEPVQLYAEPPAGWALTADRWSTEGPHVDPDAPRSNGCMMLLVAGFAVVWGWVVAIVLLGTAIDDFFELGLGSYFTPIGATSVFLLTPVELGVAFLAAARGNTRAMAVALTIAAMTFGVPLIWA